MNDISLRKKLDEEEKYKCRCKCGHSVVIYPSEKKLKKICNWCGNYVYVNKKEEFKEKIGGMIK